MATERGSAIALTDLQADRLDFHDHESRRGSYGTSLHSQPRGEANRQEFTLPQADGGKAAWLLLLGCFFIEALIWGFPLSFGVFQKYYSNNEPFASEPSGIAVIGTSATGIMYLVAPFTFGFYQRYPQYRRASTVIGASVVTASLISASFANRVWQLILTQGILYALGGTMVHGPTILFLEEWFIRRKGLAFGIMWAGSSCAGITVPFLMESGLARWGSSTMLRAWAIVLVSLLFPILCFVKPRLPISGTSGPRRLDLTFLQSPTFWVLAAGNIAEGLGFFIPSVYLPTYVSALGFDSVVGTTSVALINAASVAGSILVGSLIDRMNVVNVIFFISVASAVSVFLVWGLAVSIPALVVFSLLYGISAGGWSTTWTGIVYEVRKNNAGADSGVLLGLLAAGRGVGAVASGPLSEALLNARIWEGEAGFAYGTGYGSLIVFTGVTAAVGGCSFLVRRTGWI